MRFTKGISLLEIMLSIALISVIMIVSLRYYQTTRYTSQVNTLVDDMKHLLAASQRWYVSHHNFKELNSIDDLIDRGLLPDNFGEHPWGGEIEVVPDAATQFTNLVVTKLHRGACNRLLHTLSELPEFTNASCKLRTEKPRIFFDYSVNIKGAM